MNDVLFIQDELKLANTSYDKADKRFRDNYTKAQELNTRLSYGNALDKPDSELDPIRDKLRVILPILKHQQEQKQKLKAKIEFLKSKLTKIFDE